MPSVSPPIPISPLPDGGEDAPAAPMDPYEKVPVAAAQQDTTCKSTITIGYKSGGRQGFNGKVDSGEAMCKKARKVQIKKDKKTGKDRTVARAVTNTKGAYFAPERNARGKYYAVVAKATTESRSGDTIVCQAAKSKTIRP